MTMVPAFSASASGSMILPGGSFINLGGSGVRRILTPDSGEYHRVCRFGKTDDSMAICRTFK
jgi:hypothetical protein